MHSCWTAGLQITCVSVSARTVRAHVPCVSFLFAAAKPRRYASFIHIEFHALLVDTIAYKEPAFVLLLQSSTSSKLLLIFSVRLTQGKTWQFCWCCFVKVKTIQRCNSDTNERFWFLVVVVGVRDWGEN